MTFVCVDKCTYLIKFMNHRLLILLIIIIYQSMLGFFAYSLVLCSIWSFFFSLLFLSRIMTMIEMSWHTIYVNVLRWDCTPYAMHKSRCCASYLAYGSIVAYSCVQRPMYIYEACFLIYFVLFRENDDDCNVVAQYICECA